MAIASGGLMGLGAAQVYEFKIQRSNNGQYYWTLHSTRGNTEPVAVSEMYTTKQSAQHTIEQIKLLAAGARVTDLTK